MLRNHKAVFETVKKSKRPVVVTSQNQPQIALISLDVLETIQLKADHSAKALMDIAEAAEQLEVEGPHDLAEKHNEYTWDFAHQFTALCLHCL